MKNKKVRPGITAGILSLFLLLCGCAGYHYDRSYGVRYETNNGYIQIHIDENNHDLITELSITNGSVSDVLQHVNKNWSTSFDQEDNLNHDVTYAVSENEDGTYLEKINIAFYRNGFNYEDAQPLIDYLSLSDQLKDHRLYYQRELLKDDSFRYASILKEGEFVNNISLDGNPKYDWKE